MDLGCGRAFVLNIHCLVEKYLRLFLSQETCFLCLRSADAPEHGFIKYQKSSNGRILSSAQVNIKVNA